MKKIALVLALMISGCRTISYTDKAGNQLKISSFVWDSSIGSLSASNGVDSVTLSNYASSPDQQALQLMDDVVKAGIIAAPLATKQEK